MANKVFLIGHGIGYREGATMPLPPGVILKFAVRPGWKSTGTMSWAYLSGALGGSDTDYKQVISGPASFSEHYLCPDLPMINMAKLKQFFKGMQDHKYDSNTWMACVRGPNEIALSAIIQRLLSAGLSSPLEIIWTCCRSPINETAIGDVKYDTKTGTINENPKSSPKTTSCPSEPEHKKHDTCAEGVLTVLSTADIHRLGGKRGVDAVLGTNKTGYNEDQIFGKGVYKQNKDKDVVFDWWDMGAMELAF